MGLDGVELIMEIEEAFEISIGDDEIPQIVTVGDLAELVEAKLGDPGRGPCLTSHCFYRMRSALRRLFRVSRSEIRPPAPMETLIPIENRRKAWRDLSSELGLHLPKLELPTWLQSAILAGAGVLLILGFLGGMTGVMATRWAWLLVVAAVPYLMFAFMVAQPFATRIPNDCSTLRDVSRCLVRLNFHRVSEDCRGWTSQEVWKTVKGFVVAKAAADPDTVRPETRIVEDLRIG